MEWIKKHASEMLLVACVIFYAFNIFLATGIYDINDGLNHYLIAHFAPKHPHLFLDHWGKPLFTTLSAAFAQFGIKGVMVFNTLLYAATGWFLLAIAKNLELKFRWILPVILAFAPVYFQVVMGGLTEVLFAALLVIGTYFLQRNRFVLAALVFTFLPFARSEAYFVLPLVVLFFLAKKQWVSILLLGLAPLILSSLGWFVFNDFFWIINQNPYTGAAEIYGAGNFWRFADHANSVFGIAVFVLGTLGILWVVFSVVKTKRFGKNSVLLFAAMAFCAVFFGHSYFWWKGLFGSLGLLRVVATVLPFMALLALVAINKLVPAKWQKVGGSIAFGVGVYTVINLWTFQPVAKKQSQPEKLIKELAAWYKLPKNFTPNVCFLHPAIGYYLQLDPFDAGNTKLLWSVNKIAPSTDVRNGGLLIYDGARTPNEGNLSKEAFFADENLKQIARFAPEEPLKVMNNYDFELIVFQKHIDAEADTLAIENFAKPRPIAEERLKLIKRDGENDAYMLLGTSWQTQTVYTFWQADFNRDLSVVLDVNASKPVEKWAHYQYNDGSKRDEILDPSGLFTVPKLTDSVRSVSVVIRNPKPSQPIAVYGWCLRKAD